MFEELLDPNNATWEHFRYLGIGGAIVLVLALLLAFLLPKVKIPGAIVAAFGALALGVTAGVLGMAFVGYQLPTDRKKGDGASTAVLADPKGAVGAPGGGKGMPGMGMPGMGMGMPGMPGMGGGGKGGGPKGPSNKAQLASLVGKLQQLTEKPLHIALNDKQKSVISEHIKGLAELEELSDDDAKKRFDAILEVVTGDRKTMEAAGFRWPGAGAGGGGGGGFGAPPPANPFTADDNKAALEALGKTVGLKK